MKREFMDLKARNFKRKNKVEGAKEEAAQIANGVKDKKQSGAELPAVNNGSPGVVENNHGIPSGLKEPGMP